MDSSGRQAFVVAFELLRYACVCFRLLINAAVFGQSFFSILAFLLVPPLFWFTFEWQRLYGITLSRKFRAIVNLASVLATFKDHDPLYQLYADERAKILSCCDGPGINPDLPRTAEEVS